MIDLGKKNLLGVNISAIDYEAAVRRIVSDAQNGRRCTVTALAVHGVMTGVLDNVQRHRLNALDLVVPDGQPVRWGLNLLHRTSLAERVYGPTLMLKVCEAAAKEQLPIYLFGASQETLESLRSNLVEKFPKLVVIGMSPSRFRKLTPEENQELIEQIKNSGAKICFAGIGCPRQEVWAYEMGDQLQMPILAVGAAFAFHAGKLSQAPSWMQDRGLEWLYRLVSEPTRLWRRYLFLNPAYLFLLALQKLKLKKFNPNSATPPNHSVMYG